MNKEEEVRKILRQNAIPLYEFYGCYEKWVEIIAREICQLFEPKADKWSFVGSLQERIDEIVSEGKEAIEDIVEQAKDETASIKDAEHRKEIKEIFIEIEERGFLNPELLSKAYQEFKNRRSK